MGGGVCISRTAFGAGVIWVASLGGEGLNGRAGKGVSQHHSLKEEGTNIFSNTT